jgi:hypothetical protein
MACCGRPFAGLRVGSFYGGGPRAALLTRRLRQLIGYGLRRHFLQASAGFMRGQGQSSRQTLRYLQFRLKAYERGLPLAGHKQHCPRKTITPAKIAYSPYVAGPGRPPGHKYFNSRPSWLLLGLKLLLCARPILSAPVRPAALGRENRPWRALDAYSVTSGAWC